MKVYIGWDAQQMLAYVVAEQSLRRHAHGRVDVRRVAMPELQAQGLYTRPTTAHAAATGYWDVISEAPMSTGHAIARFLVPALCGYEGLAVFTDGDVLYREDIARLFALADPRYALQVVQHKVIQAPGVKMQGQAQVLYARKNWSSVMLFNCAHPANRALTPELVNRVPGRDLHRFCWLDDAQLGPLPPRWNVLVGEQADRDPAIAHFTLGVPNMAGYEHQPYADEWYLAARQAGYRLQRPPRRPEARRA
jgi:hypothetical protein